MIRTYTLRYVVSGTVVTEADCSGKHDLSHLEERLLRSHCPGYPRTFCPLYVSYPDGEDHDLLWFLDDERHAIEARRRR